MVWTWAIAFYLIFCPLVILISIAGTVAYRRNRLARSVKEPPFDFQKTNEIFTDPTTGIKQQVWFNPNTGERYYQNIEENRTNRTNRK
ncbi:hypothetical protein [Cohnella zeiphila]|uniref:HD family phosphohydrolase n=1 Tax=Cohnella zeiphila TaxID=2761120 RepID=A0A7X0SS52_9BACL|nr:hypothetical protein [Cohnella zeiphila]MBB6735133.1 hypothetical protein [Cohnella zeiphila]